MDLQILLGPTSTIERQPTTINSVSLDEVNCILTLILVIQSLLMI